MQSLIILKPETIINWHRKGFKLYWRWKSKRKGRPRIETEIIQLIKQMAEDNPQWGIPRIHGEMLKLGYEISESTVMRYMSKMNDNSTGQSWKTFLKNHSSEIISSDYFCVPTISYKLLHVLVFLSHERRKIIHYNVIFHPTSEWAVHQLRNAFYDSEIP